MKQTYDVPEKVVVMELEQLSLNDVQQSIEERPNKISDTNNVSKQILKDGTTPELRRDNRIVYTARSWMSFILNENLQLHFIHKLLLNCHLQIW